MMHHAVCFQCHPNLDGPALCGVLPDVHQQAADITCPICADLIDAPCPTCQPHMWAVWVKLRDADDVSMYQTGHCGTLDRMKTIVILAAVAALAGCGSTAGTSSQAKAATTPASVAKQLGCTNVQAVTGERELYTKDSATCTMGGRTYVIDTFADSTDRDNWIKVAKQVGGLGDYKSGPDWVANPQ